MLDWIIIGGGAHGVCAAQALVAAGADVRIVDPSGGLMDRWAARAERVAMRWMRSPLTHHVDSHPLSLHQFLHLRENEDVAELAGSFRRPTHAAFLRHARHVVERRELEAHLLRGRVESIELEGGLLRVLGEGVDVRSRRVLVATGANVPRVPTWARRLERLGAPLQHLFGAEADLFLDVLGGGISAVQRALMVQSATGHTVRLWMRRPLSVADFDIDRSQSTHRFVDRWSRLEEAQRVGHLERHPVRGSVPNGLAARLTRAVRQGTIHVEENEPAVSWCASSERLVLRGGKQAVESEGLTLATGLEVERVPGWLRAVVGRLGLPTVGGLPRLDHAMHWGLWIHVCGPLARLRLGPMASNLIGGRWATSKLPGVRMQPT